MTHKDLEKELSGYRSTLSSKEYQYNKQKEEEIALTTKKLEEKYALVKKQAIEECLVLNTRVVVTFYQEILKKLEPLIKIAKKNCSQDQELISLIQDCNKAHKHILNLNHYNQEYNDLSKKISDLIWDIYNLKAKTWEKKFKLYASDILDPFLWFKYQQIKYYTKIA